MSDPLLCVLCEARTMVRTGDFLGATASMVLARVLLVGSADAVRYALCEPDRVAFDTSLRVAVRSITHPASHDTKTE